MLLCTVGISIGINIGKNSNQIGSVCATLVIDLPSHPSPHPDACTNHHQPQTAIIYESPQSQITN
jgi:hypothetical protein